MTPPRRATTESQDPQTSGWLYEPLRLVEAFVAGAPLAPQTGRMLQDCYQHLYDQQHQGPLSEGVRELMLWAQGHKEFPLLEIRELCFKARLLAAELPESPADERPSVLELLRAWHRLSPGHPDHPTVEATLLSTADQWADELHALAELLDHQQTELPEHLDSLLRRCMEVAEDLAEQPTSVPLTDFEQLCQEWAEQSPQIALSVEATAQRQARQRPHLTSLQRAAEKFRAGLLSGNEWLAEVGRHKSRWDAVKDGLRSHLSPQEMVAIVEIEASLQTLSAIERPDDARIDSSVAIYCQSLRNLEEPRSEHHVRT